MAKKLCPVHRYFYEGDECPICRAERLERYSKHYVKERVDEEKRVTPQEKKRETTSKNKERAITQSDLERLVNKFKK